jgi:hypothetical protein
VVHDGAENARGMIKAARKLTGLRPYKFVTKQTSPTNKLEYFALELRQSRFIV